MAEVNRPNNTQDRDKLKRAGAEIRIIMDRFASLYWKDLLKEAGLLDAMEDEFRAIGEIDDMDMEELSQLSLKAMKRGMSGPNPNAQMVRTFTEWQMQQRGLKQLESVQVEIVPASVPDDLSPEIQRILTELRHIAIVNEV